MSCIQGNDEEILIQVKRMGFSFFVNRRIKYNLINPVFLAFFKEDYPPTEEEYQANQKAVEKIVEETQDFFIQLPDNLKWYFFKGVIHYVGKGVIKCNNGKFRICSVVTFSFDYEGKSYIELFNVDKNIDAVAILGLHSFNKLTKMTSLTE